MSLTLPVDFVVKPGSLKGALDKAGMEATRAAADAAKAQAAQLKYLDGIRQRYFAEEQRRRDQEVRAAETASRTVAASAEKAAADAANEQKTQAKYLDDVRQRYFAEEQRRRTQEIKQADSAAKAQARGLERLQAELGAVSDAMRGVSSEQARLNRLERAAGEAFASGAISAEDYASAIADIKKRSEQLTDESEAMAHANRGAAKGFGEVADAAGLPVDRVKKLIEGYEGLSASASPAVVAAGALGVGLIGVGAAAIAATAAAAALVAGVVAVTKASADALPDLEKLATISGVELFTAADADRTRTAAAAIDVVGASAKAAGVALSSQLSPYVIEAATEMIALNLALADFLQANQDLIDGVVKVGTALVDAFLQPLQATALALSGFFAQLVPIVRLVDGDLAGKLDEVAAGIAKWAVAGPVAGTVNALKEATSGYRDEAGKLIEGQKKLNKEVEAAGEAIDVNADYLWEQYAAAVAAEATIKELTLTLEANKEAWDLATSSPYWASADTLSTVKTLSAAIDEAAKTGEDYALVQADIALALSRNELTLAQSIALTDQLTASQEAANKAAPGAGFMAGVSAVQGGLEGIATLIGGPVAGAIASLILNLEDTLSGLTEQLLSLPDILASAPGLLADFVTTLLTEVVPALLAALPDIVTGLVEAIPTIIDGVIAAIPLIVMAAIESAPLIIQALITGLPDIIVALVSLIPELVKGLFEALKAEAKAAWDWITGDGIAELVRGLIDGLKAGIAGLFGGGGKGGEGGTSKAGDALREIGTLGQAKTNTYGDTPGAVRAGVGGMLAMFAPGDLVSAAKSREQLARQTGGSSAPAQVNVSLSDGHLAFDRELRRAISQPRIRSETFGFTSARKLA